MVLNHCWKSIFHESVCLDVWRTSNFCFGAYLFSTVPALYSAFFNSWSRLMDTEWRLSLMLSVLVFVMRPNYENGRPIHYIVSHIVHICSINKFTFFIVTQVYELGSIVQAFIFYLCIIRRFINRWIYNEKT